MPMSWPRRSHGALQLLADNLWIVEGPVPGLLGYRRKMVLARDEQRRLLLHSAIALDEAGMAQLEALGTPTWLVVPNGYHRLDAPAYKQRYPELRVVAPRGSSARVSRALNVDVYYEEFPRGERLQLSAAWPDAAEGVVQIHSADGVSLVFNDLLWTPTESGWSGRVHRLLRQQPQVPWLSQRMYAPGMTGRARLRAWLQELAETPGLVRAIPGHGPAILRDASAVLQRVAAQLA